MYTIGKDFTSWHKEKQYIDTTITTKYPKERQIWNIKLGVNIGDEENGKSGFIRPVLVIKRIGSLYFVIPLTTKVKYNIFHYCLHTSTISTKSSLLILSQGRVIDSRRLQNHLGWIDSREFLYIKKLLNRLYL